MAKPVVVAKMLSECGTCTGVIHKGDLITKRGKRWHHKNCVTAGAVTVSYAST